MSAIGYSNTLPSAYQPVSNPYVSSPSYGGDPGTYGVPYQSPAVGQQNFMMSIYMSMSIYMNIYMSMYTQMERNMILEVQIYGTQW